MVPNARVACADRELSVADLDRLSAEAAEALMAAGYASGSRHLVAGAGFPATVERLASARIGVVLADTDTPSAAGVGHLDVLEQRVWSETPVLETPDGTLVTHGAVLAALDHGAVDPRWPHDLVAVVGSLLAAGGVRVDTGGSGSDA